MRSGDSGYRRDYEVDSYLGYVQSPRLLFSVKRAVGTWQAEEWVLGVSLGSQYEAYPYGALDD